MGEVYYRALTRETADDFEEVVLAGFGEEVRGLTARLLDCPTARAHFPAGAIGYTAEGKPGCVLAGCVREMFWGREKFLSTIIGTMSRTKGDTRQLLPEVLRRAYRATPEVKLGYVNSANVAAIRLISRCVGGVPGPESWLTIRSRFFSSWRSFCWRVRAAIVTRLGRPLPTYKLPKTESVTRLGNGRILRRRLSIDGAFADFWTRYLETNEGFVSSRAPDELEWAFGEAVRKGEAVMLALEESGAISGYIVLHRHTPTCRNWAVSDWIALGNDESRLEALLKGAITFLKRETPAIQLHACGFPMWVQPLLARYLPTEEKLEHNRYYVSVLTDENAAEIEAALFGDKSWMFGTYDGDACLF